MKIEAAIIIAMQIGNRHFGPISLYAIRLAGSHWPNSKRVSNALQRLRRKRRVRYDRRWQEWRLR